jgi:lipopolysaccharide transport system permease protein
LAVNVVEIESGKPWWHFDLGEVWSRRDLLYMLVRKDLSATYKQSLLGPLWFVIQPIFTSLVFGLLFGRFARMAPAGVSPFLYFFSGYVLWNYYQATVSGVALSLFANSAILGKIYFPRLIVPLVAAGVNTVRFAVSYILFLAIFLFALLVSGRPVAYSGADLALVPPLLLFVGLVATGAGAWMAAASIKYRDMRHGMSMLLNLWMFATPIIWPLSRAPEAWRWVFALNPMTFVVEFHRAAFLGTVPPGAGLVLPGLLAGALAIVGGFLSFNRAQATLVDTL